MNRKFRHASRYQICDVNRIIIRAEIVLEYIELVGGAILVNREKIVMRRRCDFKNPVKIHRLQADDVGVNQSRPIGVCRRQIIIGQLVPLGLAGQGRAIFEQEKPIGGATPMKGNIASLNGNQEIGIRGEA